MVRSLWSAATGMIAQQTNVDTIANNLANVNTTGYKTQANQFKSLLYQNLQTKTTSGNNETKPTGAQVGLGVRNAAITSIFKQGNLLETTNDTDFAIEGEGFFAVRGEDGETYYTRNGNFVWAINSGGGITLTNSDGLKVLDSRGRTIELGANYITNRITVASDGEICYPNANGNPTPIGVRIGAFQFNNPTGLTKEGDSLYAVSDASGPAINEATNNQVVRSRFLQGYLESSNVQVADEMVNLIVAQRAYELNSKAITASDQMMQQANQLRS
ncbi:MAG: flagellar basal-body rod protein FlgG [Lachnospiraceae bacterium]|nr:flagellar basal-body rod protein FlgG [Lachnospiraceae bacterium]